MRKARATCSRRDVIVSELGGARFGFLPAAPARPSSSGKLRVAACKIERKGQRDFAKRGQRSRTASTSLPASFYPWAWVGPPVDSCGRVPALAAHRSWGQRPGQDPTQLNSCHCHDLGGLGDTRTGPLNPLLTSWRPGPLPGLRGPLLGTCFLKPAENRPAYRH